MKQSTSTSNNSTTNNRSYLLTRVEQLSKQLQNSATVLPVYVRFQKVDQYLTLPVINVAINSQSIEVKTDDDSMHSINIESLSDIVAFRDASGKAIFLTEFPTGGNIAEEYNEELEKASDYELASRIEYQDVYLPINDGKNIAKPIIKTKKRTEKVYSYVVKLKYDHRLAA